MGRDWLAVYVAILNRPKYRKLSPVGKGALLHVLALAGTVDPEAIWTPDDLADSLSLDGFPDTALGELRKFGWLDTIEDGRLAVHDWDEWQRAASAEIRRRWEAERKRTWRNSKRDANPPQTPPTGQDNTGHDKGPGNVPDTSGTLAEPLEDWDSFSEEWGAFLEAWRERGFRYPPFGPADAAGSQRATLWAVVRDYPTKAAQWCREAPPGRPSKAVVGYILDKRNAEVRSAA